ncbi:MAG: class I SAM-dependent methyltransferase, partial [Bacteroidetes bacterium]|nr:class I SAM-dependent methyltransferase [Bacteroidota bacterium]
MAKKPDKPEFWESNFIEKREMWGLSPAASALLARDLFVVEGTKTVLIPGIGYGRNAQPFIEAGMSVTGIEISNSAIDMAHKHYGNSMTIYHGSVTDMPFDNVLYDGIFCFSLIHLLDSIESLKLIEDCYKQLNDNGLMVFIAISKAAHTYGQGKYISLDRYEIHEGVKMF